MKGETVTLDTKTPTQADDVIEWKFKNTLIAKVDRRINPQPDPALDGRFRGRLDVDLRGYLIITHIKSNESGLYDVHITNSKHIIHKRFSLTVSGVFSAYVTVSVMKGDNVTLNPNVKHEMLRWKFKDTVITTIEQFRNRLNVDTQTGSLTIKNIRTEDTGEYKLEIKTSTDKTLKPFKTFNVTLNDQVITVCSTDLTDPTITNIRSEQFGEYKVEINCIDFILHRTLSVYLKYKVESVSGVEGGTVTLNTDTQPQTDDVIEWKFKNTSIAKMDRRIPSDYFRNKTLIDRLNVDWDGSLIITQIKMNESGLYYVNITNSKHIIYKRFRVTVSGSHREKICTLLFVPVMMLLKVLV